ncbi:LysR family transcriptional regulator [Aliikangiella sp. IMCC44359]|uniref:LysR family transcriptional regulator n=1 Tax=Aliikangiella sp. IMCC44359 TaxID=3459125 RepID=UPI00403A8E9C
MRLRHIEIFNAVYTTGSVSSAAKMLNITQPTASKILKHAENQLGFLLFERVKGRLLPTEEAKTLFIETRNIYKQISSLKRTSRNLARPNAGCIRIAVVAALGVELLPKAIVEFRKRHSDVQFEVQILNYNNIVSALLEHNKDIGIVLNPFESACMSEIDLAQSEFVCVYSQGEFDHIPGRLRLSDLHEHPFISIEDSGPLSHVLSTHIADEPIGFDSSLIAQTYFVARNLVTFGGGISIVDEFTARSEGAGKVKYKGFEPPLYFNLSALHVENKRPPKICLDFLKFFQEEFIKNRTPI